MAVLSIPCNCCEYLFVLVNYKQRANLVIYGVIGHSRSPLDRFILRLKRERSESVYWNDLH